MPACTTKNDVQVIVNKAVDDLSQVIQSLAQHVDARLNKVGASIAELNKKYDYLITTLGAFLKRLDDIEADHVARDAQLARLDLSAGLSKWPPRRALGVLVVCEGGGRNNWRRRNA